MRSRRTAMVAAVAAVLLPLATYTHAAAAASGVRLYTSVFVGGDNTDPEKQVQARCPAGTRLVGGGGRVDDHGSRKVMLTQLVPLSQGTNLLDTYYVTARNSDPSFTGSWSVEAYAICAWGQAVPKHIASTWTNTDLAPATFKAGKMECPPGQRVVGAGASTLGYSAPAGLQLVRASGPLDITRGTARLSQADPHNWRLSTHAVCADPIPGIQIADKITTSTDDFVSCPAGTIVFGAGGGGSLTDSGKVFLRNVSVSPDLRRVYIGMTAAPAAGIAIQAICAPTT